MGEGSIPLKEIMEEAKNCSLSEYAIIIDQDDSLGDMMADLATGVAKITRLYFNLGYPSRDPVVSGSIAARRMTEGYLSH
ncbi:MAG TPA: hypothetical protein GXX75_20260 [Clostridiales bacterium]|nr:hypothetical protein [Clostridiales bacterium]